MLRAWLVIYVFVGIQMGWVLRPFVGNPVAPVQFFREGSWSNAYEVVLQMMLGRSQRAGKAVAKREGVPELAHVTPIAPMISAKVLPKKLTCAGEQHDVAFLELARQSTVSSV